MENTAATPMTEWYVQTEDRQYVWSATDQHHLFRQLVERGIEAKRVLPYAEYMEEVSA